MELIIFVQSEGGGREGRIRIVAFVVFVVVAIFVFVITVVFVVLYFVYHRRCICRRLGINYLSYDPGREGGAGSSFSPAPSSSLSSPSFPSLYLPLLTSCTSLSWYLGLILYQLIKGGRRGGGGVAFVSIVSVAVFAVFHPVVTIVFCIVCLVVFVSFAFTVVAVRFPVIEGGGGDFRLLFILVKSHCRPSCFTCYYFFVGRNPTVPCILAALRRRR